MVESTPLVSVICVTFNHEKYIAETIEGFLIQKTDFDIEIIIHDDCSTDGTPQIIKEYQLRYPHLIKPILQITNQFSRGKKITPIVLPMCKGKYIAMCEGDDFWTDPYKLSKQVKFLEENSNFSACFHQVRHLYSDGSVTLRHALGNGVTLTIHDLIKSNVIATCSILYRKAITEDLDFSFMDRAPAGDWILFLHIAYTDPIYFMSDNMATYRVHDSGFWSSKSVKGRVLAGVKVLELADEMLKYKFQNEFRSSIKNRKKVLTFNYKVKSVLYGMIKKWFY